MKYMRIVETSGTPREFWRVGKYLDNKKDLPRQVFLCA